MKYTGYLNIFFSKPFSIHYDVFIIHQTFNINKWERKKKKTGSKATFQNKTKKRQENVLLKHIFSYKSYERVVEQNFFTILSYKQSPKTDTLHFSIELCGGVSIETDF